MSGRPAGHVKAPQPAARATSQAEREAIERQLGLAPGTLLKQELAQLSAEVDALAAGIAGQNEDRLAIETSLGLPVGRLSHTAD